MIGHLCATCQDLPHPAEPTGPTHFAARFGQRGTVHLDGTPVSDYCNEGDTAAGWVHLFDLDPQGRRVACEGCGEEIAIARWCGHIEFVPV